MLTYSTVFAYHYKNLFDILAHPSPFEEILLFTNQNFYMSGANIRDDYLEISLFEFQLQRDSITNTPTLV